MRSGNPNPSPSTRFNSETGRAAGFKAAATHARNKLLNPPKPKQRIKRSQGPLPIWPDGARYRFRPVSKSTQAPAQQQVKESLSLSNPPRTPTPGHPAPATSGVVEPLPYRGDFVAGEPSPYRGNFSPVKPSSCRGEIGAETGGEPGVISEQKQGEGTGPEQKEVPCGTATGTGTVQYERPIGPRITRMVMAVGVRVSVTSKK